LCIFGLALPVGAAHEPECPPLVRRQLAALEASERRDKLVDVCSFAKDKRVRPNVVGSSTTDMIALPYHD